MPPAKPTPAALLDLLVSKAKGLRDAGILRVELEGCKFDLAPADVAVPEVRRIPADEVPIPTEPDAMNDPATYGTTGRVPGFTRRSRDDESI